MKSVFLLFALSVLMYACTNSNSAPAENSKRPNDTTQIVGVFEMGQQRALRMDFMWRVTKDTLSISKDSSKLTWARDTSYFAPIQDTIRNPTTYKPVLDSVGKPQLGIFWVPLPRQNVWKEFNK